jgi:UDP-glucose 4-epimerase
VTPLALVTGAAGFIGSHLSEELVRKGFTVLGIDNLSVGRSQNLSALNGESFRLLEADVSVLSPDDLPISLDSITHIFHLGALADIVPSVKSPTEYFEANVQGTLNILEIARRTKIKKFVYAASSSCYGIPSKYPTPELTTVSPEYPYALTKYLGEELVLHWGKVYDLPVLSLRLFNVFGPRARTSGTYGAVFGVFLAQKRAGKPLTVVGDGSQTRDFTYVADVVDAFILAAKSDVQNEVFNVGSGGTYSVNQLVTLIGGDTVRIPRRPGEPNCTFADITKISNLLGWRPKVSFEEGVKKMLEDLESWQDAPVWTPETIEKETELWFRYLSRSEVKNNDE